MSPAPIVTVLNPTLLLSVPHAKLTLEEGGESKEWPVEAVLLHRFVKGKPIFLVHWKGYDVTAATWEPHENVWQNDHYHKCRRGLSQEERDQMQIPEDIPIGSDEDGLCVRRAVQELRLPDMDLDRFTPWMPLKSVIAELEHQGCYVAELRKKQRIRRKKLLLIKGQHAAAFHCEGKKRYTNPFARNHLVYFVVKRSS